MTTGTGTRTPTRRRPMMWLGAGGLLAIGMFAGFVIRSWFDDGRPTWHW